MATSRSGKKVVRVDTPTGETEPAADWKPTPEANSAATRNRIIAFVLWLVAIGIEIAAIFTLLRPWKNGNLWKLLVVIAVIAVLSIVGSILWKKANRLDPARRSEPTKFFIQNQLGAFMAVLAFLPLVVLILTNKDMKGKDKWIASAAGIVALLVATLAGVSKDSPSVEKYTAETAEVIRLTGKDQVWWTPAGEVYHLCQEASAVNMESKANEIRTGSVGTAKAEGKKRLTLQVAQELKQCGITPPPGVIDANGNVIPTTLAAAGSPTTKA